MAARRTYLDHNATSPLRPEARDAMLAALEIAGNASSVHAEGRRARAIVETAREQIAALCGASPDEIVLTSGASEANAAVIAGRAWGSAAVSAIEHASVVDALPRVPTQRMATGADGRVAVGDEIAASLADRTVLPGELLVSLQLVNGETGVIQDVAGLVEICRRCRPDAIVHSDAVQAIGRIPVSFRDLGVDAMSVSSHKLGGPQGAGALIVRDGLALKPLVRGGGQERGRRSGTENVAAIAGFGAAADAARRTLGEDVLRIFGLRRSLEQAIVEITPDAVIVGEEAPRVANTTCVALGGARAETLVIQLDLAGIAVSAGAACSSGKVGPNRALLAMGLPEATARAAIRVSLGPQTTRDDIANFIEAWRVHVAGRRRAA